MKKAPYLSDNEFNDYVKVGVFSGEIKAIAERTPEKEWAKDLRTAATKLEKVARARVNALDDIGLLKAKRKIEHSDLRFVSSDEDRGKKQGLISKSEPKITLDEEDFVFLIKVIDLAVCKNCGCRDAKNCELRKVYHTIGRVADNDTPQEFECEFKVKENK